MMRLVFHVIAGISSLWLAVRFISGIEFNGEIKYLILAGCVLGLINFFIKPILKAITLPIRIITFGLFGLVLNILIVWVVDILFSDLIIKGITPLFWTTLIIWGVSFLLGLHAFQGKSSH